MTSKLSHTQSEATKRGAHERRAKAPSNAKSWRPGGAEGQRPIKEWWTADTDTEMAQRGQAARIASRLSRRHGHGGEEARENRSQSESSQRNANGAEGPVMSKHRRGGAAKSQHGQ